jgi:hypothetical protein
MRKLNLKDVTQYVEKNIGTFHQRRLEAIKKQNLSKLLGKKNPYLYKAKNVSTASEIVNNVLDAHLSSSEETILGDWLEGLAIFINKKVYGGRKAITNTIDLDFDKDNIRYLVVIKSGPNWANRDQLRDLINLFNSVRKTLRTSGSKVNVCCVTGCCYGKSREKTEYKANGDYYKICGKRFWELISGNPNLFIDIVEPLGTKAKEKNEEFNQYYSQLKNKFTQEFIAAFCKEDMSIDWEKIVRLNAEFKVAKVATKIANKKKIIKKASRKNLKKP